MNEMPGALPLLRPDVGLLIVYLPTADISIHALRVGSDGTPVLCGPVGDPRRPFAEGGSILLQVGATRVGNAAAFRVGGAHADQLTARAVVLAEEAGWRLVTRADASQALAALQHAQARRLVAPAAHPADTNDRIWHSLPPVPDAHLQAAGPPHFSRVAFVLRDNPARSGLSAYQ